MCNLVIIVSFWPQHVCCLKSRLTEVDYRFLSVISLPRTSKDTHSLAPADFSGAVFTCAFFQKLYKLRNVFLVTNGLSAADFCQT